MKTRIPLALTMCGTIGLAACTDPAQLNPDANYTQQGAVTGGILGAATGLVTGGDNAGRNALIGAAVGAGAGALAGNRLDQQAEDLRQSIGNDNIIINRQGDVLVVTMPQDILFDISSSTVYPGLYGDLGALARNLNQYPDTNAEIIGHTDNTGSAAYNEALSVRRAQAVADIVIREGVSPARVTVIGRGESAPIATNLTEEGRAQNRRVDILIRPTGA